MGGSGCDGLYPPKSKLTSFGLLRIKSVFLAYEGLVLILKVSTAVMKAKLAQ